MRPIASRRKRICAEPFDKLRTVPVDARLAPALRDSLRARSYLSMSPTT